MKSQFIGIYIQSFIVNANKESPDKDLFYES